MSQPQWTDIPGWLTPAEGAALQALARGRVVLELGSHQGRSTIAMALVAEHVTSVDHHRGDDGTGPADTWRAFLGNLSRYDVWMRVAPLRCEIAELDVERIRHAYGLVFVDSAHDVASVTRDTTIALAVTRPGGCIAWHDIDYPTVQEALASLGLVPIGRVDNLAWMIV